MSAEKNVEQSCSVWEQALKAAIFLAEFISHLPLIDQWYVFEAFKAGTEK